MVIGLTSLMNLSSLASKGLVLMISAGMIQPKKTGNPFSGQHLYLNYGLLGLATILKQKGYSPTVIHGNFKSPVRIPVNLITQSGVMITQSGSHAQNLQNTR